MFSIRKLHFLLFSVFLLLLSFDSLNSKKDETKNFGYSREIVLQYQFCQVHILVWAHRLEFYGLLGILSPTAETLLNYTFLAYLLCRSKVLTKQDTVHWGFLWYDANRSGKPGRGCYIISIPKEWRAQRAVVIISSQNSPGNHMGKVWNFDQQCPAPPCTTGNRSLRHLSSTWRMYFWGMYYLLVKASRDTLGWFILSLSTLSPVGIDRSLPLRTECRFAQFEKLGKTKKSLKRFKCRCTCF